MSPPPHREKDAKVEGRDPLETAPKETMAPFRRLMGRLLKVPMSEVKEQQRLYDEARLSRNDVQGHILSEGVPKIKGRKKKVLGKSKAQESSARQT